MKFNVEIECTPDELRQFMGLPDVKPMQAAIMGRMEAQMLQAAERFSPDSILRSWMSLMPFAPEQMRDMMGRFLQTSSDSGKSSS